MVGSASGDPLTGDRGASRLDFAMLHEGADARGDAPVSAEEQSIWPVHPGISLPPESRHLLPTPDLTQGIPSPLRANTHRHPPNPPSRSHNQRRHRPPTSHKARRSARSATPAANGAIVLLRPATLCVIRTGNGVRAGVKPRVGGGRRQVGKCLRRVSAGLWEAWVYNGIV